MRGVRCKISSPQTSPNLAQ